MGGGCRSVLASCFLCAFVALPSLPAQEQAEKAWVFCNPELRCQPPGGGEPCVCRDDTMEVVFDGASDSVLEYETFVEGLEIEMTVVFDTRSDAVQGWTFGLQHDGAHLSLLGATVEGTDAAVALEGGFVAVQTSGLAACPGPVLSCADPQPATGLYSAVVLKLDDRVVLPVRRNRALVARYALLADPGPSGTEIRFSDRLLNASQPAAPPVDIAFTDGIHDLRPGLLVDGWVKKAGRVPPEICVNGRDDDGDGRADCDDRDCSSVADCESRPEVCDNGRDDDLDGRTDCDDRDCRNSAACVPPPEDCDNDVDDDRDGRVDCDDADCIGFLVCRPENCGNGRDDNGDGAIDCDDADCVDAILCRREVCDNGEEDDGDFLADCDDPDCWDETLCPPLPEVCDNRLDDDHDGRIDCRDRDCRDAEPCLPDPEACDDRFDNDKDGLVDCDDDDCDAAPSCIPRPEECHNCIDDDRDGDTDCFDTDCDGDPFCSPPPEVCDNGLDDDGDGQADEDDADCIAGAGALTASSALSIAFGPSHEAADHAVAGGEFVLSLRAPYPVVAFGLAVERREDGSEAVYEIAGASSEVSGPPGNLWVVNDRGALKRPAAANRAVGAADEVVAGIERGSALAAFDSWDFLDVKLSAGAGGASSFAVQYITDLNLGSPRHVILPSGPAEEGAATEVLKVRTARRPAAFRRGDVDGSGRLNISDPLISLGIMILESPPPFRCENVLDANDDGRMDIADAVQVLNYLFLEGAAPPEPFSACGVDPTPENPSLGCAEASCGS